MTLEQADSLSVQIGQEMAKIMDEANRKCNEMLNIYGLQTQIHYKIVQIAEKTKKKAKVGRRVKKELKTQSLDKLQE
jgi:hypothetical protein